MKAWLSRTTKRSTDAELLDALRQQHRFAPFAQVQGAGLDRFCRWDGSTMTDGLDQPVSLDRLYDLRVFGSDREIHAIRRGSEWDVCLAVETDQPTAGAAAADRFTHELMIWGTAVDDVGGWTILQSRRVGRVAVPIETSDRVRLRIVEYRAHTATGNAYLLYQRLAGIVPAVEDDDG